jgi:hypothetical protein
MPFKTPFPDLVSSVPAKIDEVGEPSYDDPGLAFLFAQLRDWSLQTVRGASLISPKTEFNVSDEESLSPFPTLFNDMLCAMASSSSTWLAFFLEWVGYWISTEHAFSLPY